MQFDTDTTDDAADTLRFVRPRFDVDGPTDPDATSIYDLRPAPPPRYVGRSAGRRRQLRDTRENVLRLREALEAGWNIAPELEHEERQLAVLEAST
jgi:hypothetical protein